MLVFSLGVAWGPSSDSCAALVAKDVLPMFSLASDACNVGGCPSYVRRTVPRADIKQLSIQCFTITHGSRRGSVVLGSCYVRFL